MTRQYTAFLAKSSPYSRKLGPSPPKSLLKHPKQTALKQTYRIDPLHKRRRLDAPRLQKRPHAFQHLRDDFDWDDGTFVDGPNPAFGASDDNDSDGEDAEFAWEEEKTLVTALIHDSVPADSAHIRLTKLAHSLQDPFTAHGTQLKQDIARTLVPTVNAVKHAHARLTRVVDNKFADGLLMFDEACKKLERMAIREQDEVSGAYVDMKVKIADIERRLMDAYSRREKMFHDCLQAVDECVTTGIQELNAVPATIERTISTLEKKSKDLHKNDAGSTKAAQEKLLQGLFG